jgi:hypothetical protein
MNHIRRTAVALAGLTAAVLASAIAAPAAFAMQVPPPGGELGGQSVTPAPIAQVHAGGMPGWQIVLIAVGAALVAATVAVLLDRARAGRRNAVTATA